MSDGGTIRIGSPSGAIPLYLSPQEAADLLGVNRATLLRWARTDASIPAARLGDRTIRFHREALLRWAESRTQRSRRRSA